jgi:peptidyl-prolyl cis-trans isomerase C
MVFSPELRTGRPPAPGRSGAAYLFPAQSRQDHLSEERSRMYRRSLAGLAAVAAAVTLVACQPTEKKKSGGPVVAQGKGVTITAEEFKARLDEQSPFIRARYTTLERKKEFLDNLIRFEVLAKEAERRKLHEDPEVQNTLKKIMVQKLVQKEFQAADAAGQVPDAELQAYYDSHRDEYFRPKKVRASLVVWNAPAGSPDRAKKLSAARAAAAKLKVDEKKNTLAFAQLVQGASEDATTKATAGDLNYKSMDELTTAWGKEVATAAFALKAGESSGVIEGEKGLFLVKATGVQEEMNRPFDQVKTQIANKLFREKKTKEFDEWLKKLRAEADVKIDDKELEKVEVAAGGGAAGAPGMPGMGGGMMGGHGAGGPQVMQATPAAAPAAPAPAPAPAPAK